MADLVGVRQHRVRTAGAEEGRGRMQGVRGGRKLVDELASVSPLASDFTSDSHSFLPFQLQELKQMFAMYDKDKSGALEYKVGRQWGLSVSLSATITTTGRGERHRESR